MNDGTTNMERVQVEMDGRKMPVKRKKRIMAIQKNVRQGWGKGTGSPVNCARTEATMIHPVS